MIIYPTYLLGLYCQYISVRVQNLKLSLCLIKYHAMKTHSQLN